VVLLLAGCVALGIWLRVWHLDDRPLWVDEAFSVLYATIDWAEVIQLRRTGTNPPLYHFLLSGWVALFGKSPAAIRCLSVCFGIASLPLLFALARRLGGRHLAVMATGLLALSNLSIAYAREARFYALTQLLSLAGSLLLLRLIEHARRRDAAWYALSMSLLVWVHTYGWFVLAAHVVWFAVAVREWQPPSQRRRTIMLGLSSLAAVGLSFTPWLPVLREQVSAVLRYYWISEPGWSALGVCLRDMLVLDRWLRWPLIALLAAVLLVKLLNVLRAAGREITGTKDRRAAPARPIRPCHLWGLAAWATLPILLPFFWSKLSTPIFQLKYAIVAQAPALILLAALLARRPVVGLTGLAILTALWPPNADRGLVVEDWPGAAELLVQHTDESATIFVCRDYAYFALDYYLQGQRDLVPVFSQNQPANAFAPYYGGRAITYDEMISQLADPQAQDLWLVLRWGSRKQRQELFKQITPCRPILTIWQLRAVDVLKLGSRAEATG
jgi:hypothetical protein